MSTPIAKQPYRRPELCVYGAFRAVTQSNVSNNMNDPGNGSTSMT